jgi:agmatinase
MSTSRLTNNLEENLLAGDIAVLGIPFDEHSSFMRGAAEAPPLIWEAFRSPSANTFAESGMDVGAHPRLRYLGNIAFANYLGISEPAARVLERGARALSFGGDHSVTYPIMRAYAARYPDVHILQIDAHSDLYEVFDDNPYSHACPFARIMEEKLARGLTQVGVRTLTAHQREQARRFGVVVHEIMNGPPPPLSFDGPLYISLDLDALDPAFAPGVSHHEPGGFTVREVLHILRAIEAPVVGADIVEYNPRRDVGGTTAMVAAKLFREIAALMLKP